VHVETRAALMRRARAKNLGRLRRQGKGSPPAQATVMSLSGRQERWCAGLLYHSGMHPIGDGLGDVLCVPPYAVDHGGRHRVEEVQPHEVEARLTRD
jgi:hypothetical protein